MKIGISPYPASNTLEIRQKTLALRPQVVRITVESQKSWTVSWVLNRVKEIRAAVPDCQVHLLLQERSVPTNLSSWCRDFTARAKLLRGQIAVYTLGNELAASKFWSGTRDSYLPFLLSWREALRAGDPEAWGGAAGQTRVEVMHADQGEWVEAIGEYVDFFDLHLYGAPGTIAAPIERLLQLTGGRPVWVTELTGTLGAPLSQQEQEREIPLIFAEASSAGAAVASYLPPDSRTVYGRWQPNSLLTATGQERSTYWKVQRLIAEARKA